MVAADHRQGARIPGLHLVKEMRTVFDMDGEAVMPTTSGWNDSSVSASRALYP